jgi:5-formyltetrahydrofolate cyclo-ligase
MSVTPELAQWRKELRNRLLAERCAVPSDTHRAWSEAIEGYLDSGFMGLAGLTVGLCWPYLAEFDARPFALKLMERGSTLSLPVVVAPRTPLEFHRWHPDMEMATGVYDLPIPAHSQAVIPQVLLIPVVAIGGKGDRLGYGGGFYDRTLAALPIKPVCVALAFEISRVSSTDPQEHDVLMDFVITEKGIERVIESGLKGISAQQARSELVALCHDRGFQAI